MLYTIGFDYKIREVFSMEKRKNIETHKHSVALTNHEN